MGVSENNGTPKSSILIGFSIINHPFLGTPIFGNTHMLEDLTQKNGVFVNLPQEKKSVGGSRYRLYEK